MVRKSLPELISIIQRKNARLTSPVFFFESDFFDAALR